MYAKNVLVTLSSLVLTLAAGSAIAGPDWGAIERARAAKKAEQQEQVTASKGKAVQESRAASSGPRARMGS